MTKLKAVSFADVTFSSGFWKERLDTVISRTIPSQYHQLEAHNMIVELEIPSPPKPLTIPPFANGFTTQIFWDFDIGKWIEASSYALRHKRDEQTEQRIEGIVDRLEKAQLPDGYLNCWYIGREPENRWTNLRDNHELYNAGHLLEGAIAYFEATGRRRLLDIMERYLDHIAATFGPGDGQKRGYPGHQEIELALVKLYRLTGTRKWLDLAAYFINQRGQQPHYFDQEARARGKSPEDFGQGTYEYNQSHKPVREQDKVVGHAVRAMYMYAAMADLALELGDDSLKRACETLWADATQKRMYVTGGFGPSAGNEGFTADYDLPNGTAYAETCATVAMIFWAQRMLHLDLDGRYADILELGLFNGGLSGLGHDGECYFYDNKLQSDGSHRRWKWHNCPCCTMNVSRLVASVGGYFYSAGDEGIAVHLYGTAEAETRVGDIPVTISQHGDYPWSGDVSLSIAPAAPSEFTLWLRVPGWSDSMTVRVNGKAVDVAAGTQRGYLAISRNWQKGDAIEIDLPLAPRRLYAHPAVSADAGKVALARGPLVYCLEAADNPGIPLVAARLPADAEVEEVAHTATGWSAVALRLQGAVASERGFEHTLYRNTAPALEPKTLTAIPYFAWANRHPGAMDVWITEPAQ